jgi:hypothetical protein
MKVQHIFQAQRIFFAMIGLVCGAVALTSAPREAAAHHSDSFYFIDDRGAEGGAVRIEGTVSRVRFINPHSELFVEVPGAAGEPQRWAVETDSWNQLRTLGWDERTIEVGDRVIVIVSKSKFHDTAGRLRDLLVYGRANGAPARLYLEYIPDASDTSGRSDAPLRVLERAPQCPGTVQYDPARQRGKETLLCVALDAAALDAVRTEFRDQLAIFAAP